MNGSKHTISVAHWMALESWPVRREHFRTFFCLGALDRGALRIVVEKVYASRVGALVTLSVYVLLIMHASAFTLCTPEAQCKVG